MLCKTLRGAKKWLKVGKETKGKSDVCLQVLEGCHVEVGAGKEVRIPRRLGKERVPGSSIPTGSCIPTVSFNKVTGLGDLPKNDG